MITGDRKIRVLVVEDEYLSSISIREILTASGYIIAGEAADGHAAVEMTESLKPDVVLMDIKMPGMNGLEAARVIQKKCPAAVVIMTSYQDAALIREAGEAGVGAYLMKPPDRYEIERTIYIAIRRFEDMMALKRLNAELKDEIQRREESEAKLKQALEEKNLLMKEILHRTKNNMSSICSYIRLQSVRIHDQRIAGILQDVVNCARSMAMVQEKLYRSKDFTRIDLKEYLHDLAHFVLDHYPSGCSDLKTQFAFDSVVVSTDTAVYCGLIIAELISNTMKYAFPKGHKGNITISLRKGAGRDMTLTVADNGIGIPEDKDMGSLDSMGMQLVASFVEKIGGAMTIHRKDPGLETCIRFKDSLA